VGSADSVPYFYLRDGETARLSKGSECTGGYLGFPLHCASCHWLPLPVSLVQGLKHPSSTNTLAVDSTRRRQPSVRSGQMYTRRHRSLSSLCRKRERQIRLRPYHGQESPRTQQHSSRMGRLDCCDGGYLVHWLRFRRGHPIYGCKYPIEGQWDIY
jgi:hypothetical protein